LPLSCIAIATATISLLLRSDGCVDVSGGYGKIDRTHACDDGVAFVAISTQHAGLASENNDGANCANFIVRADGAALRLAVGEKEQYMPAPGKKSRWRRGNGSVRYVAASAMQTASYLLRDDGAVDRTKGHGKISHTMMPPVGLR
jgi:hypothetical protein